ncbi:MAG TPA: AAA family ATPase [Pyrinomonadaceae bacterium]|jgi:energy-coupling factor transporter ATP-binding protein EcfA2
MGNNGLRISRITLENIRGFEWVEINFKHLGSQSLLNVFLGDNGVGKSTLLKCLALGLASPKAASKLFEEPDQPWLRFNTQSGMIKLEFSDGSYSQLLIKLETYGERISDHFCKSEALLNEQIVICGYGAARRAFGDKSHRGYSLSEAVSTLFDYDAKLQNPELIIRRLLMPGTSIYSDTGEEILYWIDNVLLLPHGSTRLGQNGLEISGPWGDFAPLGMLGDGYKATLAWIMDFLGWVLYSDLQMLRTGVQGIVLVDEIEQHLHPSWQRRIFSILNSQFPKVQFVTTTHSPLCVIGTTDFQDEQVSLVHLRRNEANTIIVRDDLKPPRGMRADQVLTSYLFGMETTSDDQTKYEIERLSKLLSQKETNSQQKEEINHLRSSLNAKLGTPETELERAVALTTQQLLEEKQQEIFDSLKQLHENHPPKAAVEFELKRQIKDLLTGL